MLKKLTISCCLTALLSTTTLFAINESHTVKILEVKDAGSYTYIKVEENGEKFWVAINKAPVKIGQELTIKEQIWMTNFKSKVLDETFDKVLFADYEGNDNKANDVHNIHGKMIMEKQAEVRPDVKFNLGTYTSDSKAVKVDVSDLYKNKEEYKNKNVEIQGDVIQVSNKVMGNTWVKISNGKDAVIFRSPNEDEKVKIGDKVKVVGTINTDIDFGYGYKYEVLGVNGKFEVLQ